MPKYGKQIILLIGFLPTCSFAIDNNHIGQVQIKQEFQEKLALRRQPPFILNRLLRRNQFRRPNEQHNLRKKRRENNREVQEVENPDAIQR